MDGFELVTPRECKVLKTYNNKRTISNEIELEPKQCWKVARRYNGDLVEINLYSVTDNFIEYPKTKIRVILTVNEFEKLFEPYKEPVWILYLEEDKNE